MNKNIYIGHIQKYNELVKNNFREKPVKWSISSSETQTDASQSLMAIRNQQLQLFGNCLMKDFPVIL